MAKWSAAESNLPTFGERVISSVKWKAVISEIYEYMHLVRSSSYGTTEPTAENGQLWYDTNVGENVLKVKTVDGWFDVVCKDSPNIAKGLRFWYDDAQSSMVLPKKTYNGLTFTGSNPDSISIASGNFITDGIMVGRKIKVSGALNSQNNGIFTVINVTALTLTLITNNSLKTENNSNNITIESYREALSSIPVHGVEKTKSVTIVASDGDVSVDNFVTELGVPSVTEIPAGLWTFSSYCFATWGGTVKILYQVRKLNTTGIAEILGTSNAVTVPQTTNDKATLVTNTLLFTSAVPLFDTDRIVIRVLFNNSSTDTKTGTWIYQGTERPAFIDTTFTTAAKLASPVDINLTGGITGTVSFDGSKDVTIPTTLAIASTTIRGGIKLGTGFTINSDVLSANVVFELDANGDITPIS